jgi:hypothetical protein
VRNFFSSPEVKDTVQQSNAILNREQKEDQDAMAFGRPLVIH